MNKTIIWIIVAVIIIVGAILIFSRTSEAPTGEILPTESPAETTEAVTHTIVYGENGYSPGQLTVKIGDTVTFKNESQIGMWTASAVHPTHQLYPDFNARQGIAPGGEWSFIFVQKGSWGYHNHLQVSHGGRIVVD